MLRAVDAAVDAAALIARLQQHSDDPEVQAQCFEALCRSGELADEPALAFLPVIVTALRATLALPCSSWPAVRRWE
jgi:hypothetical protein